MSLTRGALQSSSKSSKMDDDEIAQRDSQVKSPIPESVDIKTLRIKLSNHYSDAFLDANDRPLYWDTHVTTRIVGDICARVRDKSALTTDNIYKALQICSVYATRSIAGLAGTIITKGDYSAIDNIKGNPHRKNNRFNNITSREIDFEEQEEILLNRMWEND